MRRLLANANRAQIAIDLATKAQNKVDLSDSQNNNGTGTDENPDSDLHLRWPPKVLASVCRIMEKCTELIVQRRCDVQTVLPYLEELLVATRGTHGT